MTKMIKEFDKYVAGTYKRFPYAFSEGKGSILKSLDGKKIVDFFPGWGVSNLGHCHPLVTKAIQDQAKKIVHMSNVFYNPLQRDVAKEIIRESFPGKVFFCNSGTEAVECAIKAAKAYGQSEDKYEFISFYNSFHGRTVGSVTLTGQSKYHDPFKPLLPGVHYAEYNHIDSVKKIISKKTVAIILELVQGEGGVRVADKKFVKELAELAKQNKALLIIDEVQTGFGRTGKFFAFKHYGIKPDILCLAKAIANGIPMGATVLSSKIENILQPGMHASTFGGNYIACAASKAVFKAFEKEKILKNMGPVQKYMEGFFKSLEKKYDQVISFRNLGMMFGIEMKEGYAEKIAEKALSNGLIINCTAHTVLRIMPALNLNMKDCKAGLKIIEKVFSDVCK